MMNLSSIFFISFIIALSGAMAPGPLLAVVISESPRQGFKTGPLVILGHAILETLMITLLLLGFSRFLNNPTIIKIIGVSGAVILIYFGIKLLANSSSLQLQPETNRKHKNLPILGITMSLANPYWTIWWLTVGLALLIAVQKTGITGIIAFFLGHISADLAWYSLVSSILSKGRKFITLKIYRLILFVCGLALVFFGLYFGLKLGG